MLITAPLYAGVFFTSPVKKGLFYTEQISWAKIFKWRAILLLMPTLRFEFEFWHQRCLFRRPIKDTHFLSFGGIFRGWNENFQQAFADSLSQSMFPPPKI
jgi:hypothetical protein